MLVMRACEGCRRRKIRCDSATTNEWPCAACVRLKLNCITPNVDYSRVQEAGNDASGLERVLDFNDSYGSREDEYYPPHLDHQNPAQHRQVSYPLNKPSSNEGTIVSSTTIENPKHTRDTLKDHTISPWNGPVDLPPLTSQSQPRSSEIPLTRFHTKIADVKTASRKATWGTAVRRMSETDLEKILGPEGLLSRLSVGKDKIMETINRQGSMRASRPLLKRSPSTVENQLGEGLSQDTKKATTSRLSENLPSQNFNGKLPTEHTVHAACKAQLSLYQTMAQLIPKFVLQRHLKQMVRRNYPYVKFGL